MTVGNNGKPSTAMLVSLLSFSMLSAMFSKSRQSEALWSCIPMDHAFQWVHMSEIMYMDSKVSALKNKSIWEILMSFKASNPKAPLMLNVCPGDEGIGFNVYVLPQYMKEAQTMLNSLNPHLKHQVGPERDGLFLFSHCQVDNYGEQLGERFTLLYAFGRQRKL
jgi:hypothetical protein